MHNGGVKGRAFAAVAALVVIFACGCGETGIDPEDFPAARTPKVVDVSRAGDVIDPDDVGNYSALPLRAVDIRLDAPWPADLAIDVDGQLLEAHVTSQPEMTRLEEQDRGYWAEKAIDTDTSPPRWSINVSPPRSARICSAGFTLNVKSLSLNGTKNGTERVSEPLSLRFVNPSPPQPFGLILAGYGARHADLAWYDTAHATAYAVERRERGADFSEVARIERRATTETPATYRDRDLQPMTDYEYRIRAVGELPGCDLSTSQRVITTAASGVFDLVLQTREDAFSYAHEMFPQPIPTPLSPPEGAVITNVTNSSRSLASPPDNGVTLADVKHTDLNGNMRIVPTLKPFASTHDFNGMLVLDKWHAEATDISAALLHWRCTGTGPDYWHSCGDNALIQLSIGWSVP